MVLGPEVGNLCHRAETTVRYGHVLWGSLLHDSLLPLLVAASGQPVASPRPSSPAPASALSSRGLLLHPVPPHQLLKCRRPVVTSSQTAQRRRRERRPYSGTTDGPSPARGAGNGDHGQSWITRGLCPEQAVTKVTRCLRDLSLDPAPQSHGANTTQIVTEGHAKNTAAVLLKIAKAKQDHGADYGVRKAYTRRKLGESE